MPGIAAGTAGRFRNRPTPRSGGKRLKIHCRGREGVGGGVAWAYMGGGVVERGGGGVMGLCGEGASVTFRILSEVGS